VAKFRDDLPGLSGEEKTGRKNISTVKQNGWTQWTTSVAGGAGRQ